MYIVFFFKQKTAYEMRISDWSSDVCSSDLVGANLLFGKERHVGHRRILISRGDRLTGYPRRKPVGKRKEHLENIEEGTNQLPSVIRANSGRVRADRGSLRAEVGTVGAAVPSACANPV